MLKKILASVLSVIMMLHGMTALTIGSEQTGTPIKNSFADSESTVENEILLSTDFLDIIYQTCLLYTSRCV